MSSIEKIKLDDMSCVLISSQGQCAVVAVPNLHPMLSTTSSEHRTYSEERVCLKQPFRSAYGLPQSSTPESQCNALQFEKLDVKSNSCSYSSSSGRSLVFWRGSRENHRTGVSRAVDDSRSCGDSVEFRGGSAVQQMQRREFVRVISSWIVLPGLINAGSALGAAATEEDEQGPESSTTAAPPAKTLVERLVERSKANKAKYDQERLDAYYRRNFKDYFGFLKGNIENKDKDKLTEAEKGILNWLEKNQ